MLLDEMALADARQLVTVTDPSKDIHAAHVLGWFRWLRYLAVPGSDPTQELSAAVGLLKPVFERNPYAVPESLQRWYLQTEAASYASHQWPEAFGPSGRGPEPGPDIERLPVFHAAVRSAVAAAPANQPDRARFLLDAALMVRGIAGRGADEAVLAEAAELTLAALGTGPATLRPPADLRLSVTPQAVLERVEGRAAAVRSVESPRPASAALPPVAVGVGAPGASAHHDPPAFYRSGGDTYDYAGPAERGAVTPGTGPVWPPLIDPRQQGS